MSFDFICVYRCKACGNYWTAGNNKLFYPCDKCNSEEFGITASFDPHVVIPKMLNGDAESVLNELKEANIDP